MRAGPLARVGPWPTAWRRRFPCEAADPRDRTQDPYGHPRWRGPGSATDGPHPSSRHPAARAPGGAGAHNDTSPGGVARGGVPRRAATREPGPVRAPHDSAAVKRGAWPGWARVHAPARRRRPEQDGMDDLIAALIRGCHLGSGIGLFGILAFAGVVGAPACRAAEAAGGASVEPLARQWLHGARWSGLAVAATSLLDLGRQATVVTENGWMASLAPPILGAVLTQTRYGRIWLMRLALLGGVMVVLAWRPSAGRGPDRRLAVALVLAGGSLAAVGAAGHAASARWWPWAAIGVDAVHLPRDEGLARGIGPLRPAPAVGRVSR